MEYDGGSSSHSAFIHTCMHTCIHACTHTAACVQVSTSLAENILVDPSDWDPTAFMPCLFCAMGDAALLPPADLEAVIQVGLRARVVQGWVDGSMGRRMGRRMCRT